MAQESQLAHRVISSPNLPYISNVSPSNTDPHYIVGSADILTSINGYAERRPGFANTVETTPTTFNNLSRLFTWDRWDGTFIIMACDINSSGYAVVYKYIVGSDISFVSILTDSSSATPYDFVTSNNTVYFSNGNLAKKWDPVNGISNWGISIGSVNNATGPNIAGAGATSGTPAWTNPNNVTSAVSYATTAITNGGGQPSRLFPSGFLQATTFGFSIPATTTINGIAVTFTVAQTSGPNQGFVYAQLMKNGTPIGAFESIAVTTSPTAYTLGSNSYLWGTTWVANDIDQTGFGVQLYIANRGNTAGTADYELNNVNLTIYGTGGPSISVSGSSGSMTATAGYIYVFCYGNSNTGHISSPTPPSSSTGMFTNKADVSITLTASTDPQVNQIRVFRTTDGGGGTYFELPTSPYANSSGAVTDSSADTGLNVLSIAPTPTFNDPPTPGRGAVYFSGRIWMFANNKQVFSGLEEINQGVPEECFPSGPAGNFWTYDETVQGQGIAGIGSNQTLGILCGGRLYGISGNTLDTFRRFSVSNRRGCRNLTCVSMLGGMMAWLDSAAQVWASNGTSLQELSQPIRPDLVGINPANCSLTFHSQGRFNWLVLSTGTKLYIYDTDQDQWLPPWNVSANYLFSGETSPGNYQLMLAKPTIALELSTTAHNDNGTTYAPVLQTNLLSVVPDFGSRFSYIATGIYNEPTRTGVPFTFQITNNAQTLDDVQIVTDDDPTQAAYTSIVANLQDTSVTYNRTNGAYMTQLVYPVLSPMSRWVGMKIILDNADQVDNIYEIVMAYKPGGGR
jgi:hypothetical protein